MLISESIEFIYIQGFEICCSGYSKVSYFIDWIIMEHIKKICSLESKLFFISICFIKIRPRKWDIIQKLLQHIFNPYVLTLLCFTPKLKFSNFTRKNLNFTYLCHASRFLLLSSLSSRMRWTGENEYEAALIWLALIATFLIRVKIIFSL